MQTAIDRPLILAKQTLLIRYHGS